MRRIEIDNLVKEYKLGTIGHGTLYKDLQSWWARKLGRPDPNALIMEDDKKLDAGGSFRALNGISFDVNDGEIVGIIGKNGAGKSTLLKILSRVTLPTTGAIRYRGRVGSLLEVGTGFHPELTGRENIFLNGAILGMARDEIKERFDEIVSFAGVERFIETPVKRYSSGMQVRLAFAVAAHLEPEILVIDEVLAVGDIDFQRKCIGRMNDLGSAGRTILFVSHNMDAVRRLCHRVVVLENGQVVYNGSTEGGINYYMHRYSELDSGELTVEEQESLPVQITKCAVLNHQGELGRQINYADEFFVDMHIRVRKPNPDYYCTFQVFDAEGHALMYSTDWEQETAPITQRPEGDFVYRLRLPARLFRPGTYWINASISNRHLFTIMSLQKQLTFEIVDTETIRAQRSLYSTGTMVAPEIQWEASPVS
ncbi:MAG: ABC transporter ATP-binding protein [bacterium]|nr:ABC transporter ATP-binding protein [bacterium]